MPRHLANGGGVELWGDFIRRILCSSSRYRSVHGEDGVGRTRPIQEVPIWSLRRSGDLHLDRSATYGEQCSYGL